MVDTAKGFLASGGFGDVYKGVLYETKVESCEVAVKCVELNKLDADDKNMIEREEQILKILSHENVLKLIHAEEREINAGAREK